MTNELRNELKEIIEKVFYYYDLTSDPHCKGEDPYCDEYNDIFEKKARNLKEKDFEELLSGLDQPHLDALYPALSNLGSNMDRPYLNKYLGWDGNPIY